LIMGTMKKNNRGVKQHKSSSSLSNAQQEQKAQALPAPIRVDTHPQHPQHPQHPPMATNQSYIDDQQLAYALPDDRLTPFSRTLRRILQLNHLETSAIAKTLGVTENTIYRWLNGRSEPRQSNLRALLEALPEHRTALATAMRQTFSYELDQLQNEKREFSKEVYQEILEMVAHFETDEEQVWHVTQCLFDHALLLLDRQQRGLSLTYAAIMPSRADGSVHSLREVITRGSYPWPSHYEDRVFLGRTTLAGQAAVKLRTCTWYTVSDEYIESSESTGHATRMLVEVDDHERSACACPVLRFGQFGGVLVVSSTDPELFRTPDTCSLVEEMARLLATVLHDRDLCDPGMLHLVPMPALDWQRRKINTTLMPRIMRYVRKAGLSRQEAEMRASAELEQEFEEEGRSSTEWSAPSESDPLGASILF
jgi:transcriptional regulator with XRE-family HTH domain